MRTAREQLDRVFAFAGRAWRHWWKAALIVAIGGAASVGVALKAKRKYRSETVLLYREPIDQTYVAGSDARRISSHDLGRRLRELLMGRPRLKEVIDKFKILQQVVNQRSYIEAEDKLRMLIDFRFGGGDTFHLAYTGFEPKRVKDVTEYLAKIMIEEELRMRSEQAAGTVRFLDGERKRAEGELKGKEQALAEFLAKNPEFAADESPTASGAALRAQQRKRSAGASLIRSGSSPLTIMRRQLRRIKEKLAQAEGRKPTVVRDPKLQALKQQAESELANAQSRLRGLKARYTDAHPDVAAARSRVKLAQSRLARVKVRAKAATKIVKLGGDAIAALRNRLNEINSQIASYRRRSASKKPDPKKPESKPDKATGGAANRIVAMETQWTRLNREVREARERYLRIENRLFRASLGLTVKKQSHLRVIDPAYVPKRPAGGGRSKMVILGGAVSMFFAMGLVLGLALIDERIYNRKDAERLRLAEVLVVVPRRKPTLVQRIVRIFKRKRGRHRRT
ncbi:MAG: hypothetical protein CSB49_02765 [Proteobacteria bacterium]|nr:MAG: hypothetical protein CSB49_02765 [Pseudomonadota bacterium]